jgi:hypothetical protein
MRLKEKNPENFKAKYFFGGNNLRFAAVSAYAVFRAFYPGG